MLLPMFQDRFVTRLAGASDAASSHLTSRTEVVNANPVPTERQTNAGIEASIAAPLISREFSGMPLTQIRSNRQSPSAILTEQFLAARAASAPIFIHNTASVKAERISNLYADAPRFTNQLDVIA